MTEFTFLYRTEERTRDPKVMEQQMQAWVAWMKDLTEKGHIVYTGHPLELTGAHVTGKEKSITDGPYPEKDFVCGFTIVKARDLDQAVELSKGCPILGGGGVVEVRPVMQIPR